MSAEDLFDPERLRRRWQQTEPAHAAALPPPPALANVIAAVDPAQAARTSLAALERQCQARFRERWPALGPFFAEVWRHLGRADSPAGAAARPDATQLAEADRALESLEELLEVFAFHAPRPPSGRP